MRGRKPIGSVGTFLLLGLLLCGSVGCGSSGPYDMESVSGKVIFDDGGAQSASRISVVFAPQVEAVDPKTHPRAGSAEVNVADGTFSSATTDRYGDGLVVGQHKVRVFSYDKEGTPTELEVTPSEIEVGPGSTEFEFHVKRP